MNQRYHTIWSDTGVNMNVDITVLLKTRTLPMFILNHLDIVNVYL